MNKKLNILLVEDDEDDYFIIKELLSKITYFNHELNWITKTDELNTINSQEIDLCLADYFLGKDSALNVLQLFKKNDINIPVIVLTGMNNREKDIEVMEAGATDYLSKEKINSDKLERAIRYAIQHNSVLNQYKTERNKFQKLFDLHTDLIIILNNNFEVEDLNSQVLETLKIESKDSILGLKVTDLIAKPIMIELLKKQSNIKNKETDLTFYNGVNIEAILSLTEIFDAHNLTECYQLVIKDISEVTKAKNKLRNIEKVNFSGKMAQTFAHEIRNPLTNINLSTSFLKTGVPEEDKYVDMVLKNAKKINDITTQFINNTKAIKLKKETESINSIVENAVNLCLDRIALKDIKLDLTISTTKELKVIVDKEKLAIAISNIILNATEALHNTEQPIVKVQSLIHNNTTTIKIADNGTGISPEKIKTIFEPFTTDKQSGIGVGLSSVYNIITLHDWDIEVDSILGQGTTFSIIITHED